MSRRRRAKQLKELTAGKGREERLNVALWLQRPNSLATRMEVYQLIREYEYGVQRQRWKRTFPGNIVWALWLILSAPIRIPWKKWKKRKEEKADGTDTDV